MKKLIGVIILALLLPLTAQAASTTVTLAWDANTETDLAGYKIYHGSVTGGPYNVVATLFKVVTWQHVGLSDGKHCWVATAYDTIGNESGYSNEVCLHVDQTPPAIPKNFSATGVVKVP